MEHVPEEVTYQKGDVQAAYKELARQRGEEYSRQREQCAKDKSFYRQHGAILLLESSWKGMVGL